MGLGVAGCGYRPMLGRPRGVKRRKERRGLSYRGEEGRERGREEEKEKGEEREGRIK